MGKKHMMSHLQNGSPGHDISRGMLAGHVAQTDKTLRFIKRNIVFHFIAQILRHDPRILCKIIRDRRVLPTADPVKPVWQIPVEQRHIRLNPILNEFIHQVLIKAEAFLIHRPISLRQNPAPGHGEAVGL